MGRSDPPHTIAAVPKYLGRQFGSAPPGHRFRLYFDAWIDPAWRDGSRGRSREGHQQPWAVNKGGKQEALSRVLSLGDARNVLKALQSRHDLLARGANTVSFDYRTTSPLVTGMGIDHPVENGFSFLDPYGLPYLPGSGVKGVVRRAAEELCLFEGAPFTIADIWQLFGLDTNSAFFAHPRRDEEEVVQGELRAWRDAYKKQIEAIEDPKPFGSMIPEKEKAKDWRTYLIETLPKKVESEAQRNRGALVFWDAIPSIDKMDVDVMTPHFPKYYQGRSLPTDDQDPTPIPFLVLPAGVSVSFYVAFAPPGECQVETWREILGASFAYAAKQIGFGGKTAAGYGRMVLDARAADARARRERERQAEATRREQERIRIEAEKKRQAEEEAQRQAAERRKEDLAERYGEAGSVIGDVMHAAETGDEGPLGVAYKRIDEFDGEAQRALAEAFRDAYQHLGKWSGKKLSRRQKDKVAKIKEILGE